MNGIIKKLNLDVPINHAFNQFINELNAWWPKEYSWSQEKLVEIKIEPEKEGLCTEIGPHNFRCDWGRVTQIDDNKH